MELFENIVQLLVALSYLMIGATLIIVPVIIGIIFQSIRASVCAFGVLIVVFTIEHYIG